MKTAELYRLMESPAMLSENTLSDLKQIVDDFPYFHAARLLYLKNLETTDDLRLKVDLKKMSVQIPDRVRLFFLLEGERYDKPSPSAEPKSEPEDISLVDRYLSGTAAMEPEPTEVFIEPSASLDYIRWLTDHGEKTSESEKKMKHQQLIDSFIESGNERMERLTPHIPDKKEKKDASGENNEEGEEADNASLDDSYFTETLAHVYIRQKRYEKALEIIRSLSLKYPKKNIYFADQIRFLEKLIIHSKQ